MLKYIARHDDTGAFTHGKIPLNSAEYAALASLSTFRPNDSQVLQSVYMQVYRQLLATTKSAPCQVCGDLAYFIPAPAFAVGHDAECPECVLRCTVHATCLKCAFMRCHEALD
jgi:hypothetical protein